MPGTLTISSLGCTQEKYFLLKQNLPNRKFDVSFRSIEKIDLFW